VALLFLDLLLAKFVAPDLLLPHVLLQVHDDTTLLLYLDSTLFSLLKAGVIAALIVYFLKQTIL